MPSQKRILVCVLDWGLGHATRCVPVIRAFMGNGCTVMIASSGSALKLLQSEFPSLTFFELPSYNPKYSETNSLIGQMILQLPKFRSVIDQEHKALDGILKNHAIDVVISDNRYGCWSPRARSIFITHQLKVLTPAAIAWAGPGINWVLQQQIKKFHEVWIPDQAESGLTDIFYSKVVDRQRYVGWLSRFAGGRTTVKRYSVMAIISGPEPQRMVFLKKIKKQLETSGLNALIVTGEPGPIEISEEGRLIVINHLDAGTMEKAMNESEIVISRSGYSTIMDLIALGKNAIFVPTPGQPEQTYFAKHLMAQGMIFSQTQDEFCLEHALVQTAGYKGLVDLKMDPMLLRTAIDAALV